MKINPECGRLYRSITDNKYYLFFPVVLFFLIAAYYFLTWPVVGYDTDLWYHLSGGKYFWEQGSIVKDAFFSYITPAKEWYNYYWLFQVAVYKVFQGTGYYGLIILRALLYLLTVLFISFFFIRKRENKAEFLIGLIFLICCAIIILYRELLVRPHLFSYLFIVIFLYILEYRRDKIWMLPVLGVLWSNIHGIEYPVMFIIVFAYLAEMYYRQIRYAEQYQPVDRKTKWLLITVFYTVFVTPQVIKLIQTPFDVSYQNATYQYLYVAELLKIPWENFIIINPVTVKGFIGSLQSLMMIFIFVCFLICLWKRKIRLSHIILFCASLFLITKHARFTYEFTLLSVPLMNYCLKLTAQNIKMPGNVFKLSLPVVAVLIPLIVFTKAFNTKPSYPLALSSIPAGVAGFLQQEAAGGKILNEPNTGGYLPWTLGPYFKIFMDMQMTIFSDLDFAEVNNAFCSERAFKSFVQKYDPSFITVSLNRPYFKRIIERNGKQFIPVFFDNKEVLYVNGAHNKELSGKYALKAIDPFSYHNLKYKEQNEEQIGRLYDEALKMHGKDSINYGANHILCAISIIRQQYTEALSYANSIIQNYPDLSPGYALKGDALFGIGGRYAEAAELYEKALSMGQTSPTDNVYRNLYAAYVKQKNYKKAYNVLSKYVNPFTLGADYRDIYDLGMSAATVGKIKEAVTFLKIAGMKTPEEDREYIEKIEKSISFLESDSKNNK